MQLTKAARCAPFAFRSWGQSLRAAFAADPGVLDGPLRVPRVTRLGILYGLSPKRTILGFPTAVIFIASREERELLFRKIEAALRLILEFAPVRFRQLQRDLACIFVFGRHGIDARYIHQERMCDLTFFRALAPDLSETRLAGIIVHEGQHARLARLGIEYRDALQARSERVCYRAERVFASRVPRGEEVFHKATSSMAREPAFYDAESRLEAHIRSYYQSPLTAWFARPMELILRRQARIGSGKRSEVQ